MEPEEEEPSTSRGIKRKLEDSIEDEDSDSSNSDGTAERCPICFLSFKCQEVAKPKVCSHIFCLLCIEEWSKLMQTCPIDRKEYKEVLVYDNFATQNFVRSVVVNKTDINLDAYLEEEPEQTFCEVCVRCDREDSMLLCDGCDKGYHMACLNPPLEEVPFGSWYCDNCFSSSDEESSENEEDVTFLNEDIEENEGGLTVTRLRVRQAHRQPNARTRQSERVRISLNETAISSQPTLREVGYTPPVPRASTSGAMYSRPCTSRAPATSRPSTSRAPVASRPRKRRKKYRRRRAQTVVLEYDLQGDEKFAIKTRKIKRKIRKRIRRAMATRRESRPSNLQATNKATSDSSHSFNSGVGGLQKERASAGLRNFNIFQPTNSLEPCCSDDEPEEYVSRAARADSVAIAIRSVANLDRTQRRNLMIKERVMANSSHAPINFLDSIMNEQEQWLAPTTNNFVLEKSGKLISKNTRVNGKQSAGSDNGSTGNESSSSYTSTTNSTTTNNTGNVETSSEQAQPAETAGSRPNDNNSNNNANSSANDGPSRIPSIFDDPEWSSPPTEPAEEHKDKSDEDECPNFSIYTSESLDFTKDSENSNSQQNANKNLLYDEEDVDLVQLSDDDATLKDKLEIEEAIEEAKNEKIEDTEDIFANLETPNLDDSINEEPDDLSQIYGTQTMGSSEFAPISDVQNMEDLLPDDTEDKNTELSANDEKPELDKIKDSEPKAEENTPQENISSTQEPPVTLKSYKIPKKTSGDSDTRDADRSYTPPIGDNSSKNNKSDDEGRDSRRGKKREMQRYNVRQRMRDKTPVKLRDQFGRNTSQDRINPPKQQKSFSRSPSRSRSLSRRRVPRPRSVPRRNRRSRSFSPSDRERSLSRGRRKNRRSKSRSPKRQRSPDHRRKRYSPARHSPARHRSPSVSSPGSEDDKRKKPRDKRIKKHKSKKGRARSKSGSTSRRASPKRAAEKPKKDKKKKDQKDKGSTMKEVFTSGENILVSLNFNQEKTTQPEKPQKRQENRHEVIKDIVDITTRKKIAQSNSKPVAIIDLARSPFKELTPSPKNIIVLSDSEGEKHHKSPDSMISSKLYDPFDILSSPANDVTSSNENFKTNSSNQAKKFQKSTNFEEKKTDGNKLTSVQQTSINMIMGKLPFLDYGENMVTSSDGVNQYYQAKPSNSGTAKLDAVANLHQKPPSYPTPTLNDTMESPYSPNDGYDDLFDMTPGKKSPKMKSKKGGKNNTKAFDTLFGSTSPVAVSKSKDKKKKGKSNDAGGDKFLLKLNRQERVIEEVKLVIKPYYYKKSISKDDYKEILRKAVPKICHSKSGEINPKKIKDLIDAYVKKIKHQKKNSGIL